MRCKETGVTLVAMAVHGPQGLQSADIHSCPACGVEVVCNCATKPFAYSFEANFATQLDAIERQGGTVLRYFLNPRERAAHEAAATETTAAPAPAFVPESQCKTCPGCGAPGGRRCEVIKTTCGY
jgi:uncharacterized protein YlaN (UPF0358 family)